MRTKTNSICHLLLIPIAVLFLYSCHSKKQHHLSNASSPYLQQHADNPVNWHEWGEEALEVAKKENKPLLVSVGYASCHWCHVMEKESFMDTTVARIMNENFVCIKVDREERPDIDNIYMNACQLISGNSGWPLNAFALPDGKPFFAGTYYSKPAWISLLKKIASAYKDQNNKIVLKAQALTKGIADIEFSFLSPDNQNTPVNKSTYRNLFDSVYKDLDHSNGGLEGEPKFPMPSLIEFMLQYHTLTGEQKALEAANNTLTRIALGGIYDHAGGGFARYATDSLWRIPHFEKMLYDNGQLMSQYAHAYQITRDNFFKTVIKEIDAFITRDLASPDGGFYSSLNADTKEGEGEFYAWQWNELKQTLGDKSFRLLADYFNITVSGNWKANKNILYATQRPDEFAASKGLTTAVFDNLLGTAKTAILSERNKREKPETDDKILTSWNALMLTGYADAYAALGDEQYLQKALSNARFIEKYMITKDGRLWRNYKNGNASIDAFLDDYALLAKAFIRLYQVTLDKHWLSIAQKLTSYTIKNFYDAKSGMFFYTSSTSKTIIRKIEISDQAIPSSNGVMAEVLYCLNTYFDNQDYLNKCNRMLSSLLGQAGSGTAFYAQWCYVGGMVTEGTNEIAIIGKDALEKNLEFQKNYLPQCLVMGAKSEENLPLLKNKLVANKTLIYVCIHKTCKLPVEEVDHALEQLNRKEPAKVIRRNG